MTDFLQILIFAKIRYRGSPIAFVYVEVPEHVERVRHASSIGSLGRTSGAITFLTCWPRISGMIADDETSQNTR